MRNFAILETRYLELKGIEQTIPTRSRFRIIETYTTLDGPRSRLVDGSWSTMEAAIGYLTIKQGANLKDLQQDVLSMEETLKAARKG